MSLYNIAAYGAMIADTERFEAYREALQRAVEPGSTVVDIGTGTGIHALLACCFGARRVYAIDTSDVIQLARQIAQDNGFSQRIEFFHQASTRVSLPEQVDVMVSDLRGVLPLFGRHIPAIIDARRRLLREGGVMIPQRDEIWVAPVEVEDIYGELVSPWEDNGTDVDMSAGRAMVTQRLHRRRVDAEHLVAPAQCWATLDYATVESANVSGRLEYVAARTARVHGFALWFDATLAEGIRFSNGPAERDLIYGMNFLPLTAPVDVASHDAISVELGAALVGDDYVWKWDTQVHGADAAEPRRFSQSSFHGAPLGARSLALADSDATPDLSADGRIDREILGMLDGQTPLRDIAAAILERHPDAFTGPDEARDRVAAIARRYAE